MHQIVKLCVSVKHEIEVFETKTCTSEGEMLSREKKIRLKLSSQFNGKGENLNKSQNVS